MERLAEGITESKKMQLSPQRCLQLAYFTQTHHGCFLPLELLTAPTSGQTYTEHLLYAQPMLGTRDREINKTQLLPTGSL